MERKGFVSKLLWPKEAVKPFVYRPLKGNSKLLASFHKWDGDDSCRDVPACTWTERWKYSYELNCQKQGMDIRPTTFYYNLIPAFCFCIKYFPVYSKWSTLFFLSPFLEQKTFYTRNRFLIQLGSATEWKKPSYGKTALHCTLPRPRVLKTGQPYRISKTKELTMCYLLTLLDPLKLHLQVTYAFEGHFLCSRVVQKLLLQSV